MNDELRYEIGDMQADIEREDKVIDKAFAKRPWPYYEGGAWHVCAWHDAEWVAPDGRPVTHGICQSCKAKVLAQVGKPINS